MRVLGQLLIIAAAASLASSGFSWQSKRMALSFEAQWRVEPLAVGNGPIWLDRYKILEVANVFPSEMVFLEKPFLVKGLLNPNAVLKKRDSLNENYPLVRVKSDFSIYCTALSNLIYEIRKFLRGYSTCFLDQDRDKKFDHLFFHENITGLFVGKYSGEVELNAIEPIGYAPDPAATALVNRSIPFKIGLSQDGCWGTLERAKCESIVGRFYGARRSTAMETGNRYQFNGDLTQTRFKQAGVTFKITGDKVRTSRMQFIVEENVKTGVYHLRGDL